MRGNIVQNTDYITNKANTSDKETSFLDLIITVIDSDVHNNAYDKRDDFGFPIVNFPWLPRLQSYGITFLSFFFYIVYLQNMPSTMNKMHRAMHALYS